jgi:hypothetical protein
MGYYIDYWWTLSPVAHNNSYSLNTVTNHDYFIAQRGFFFDLCASLSLCMCVCMCPRVRVLNQHVHSLTSFRLLAR